ncbi:MAG: dephospho-CoA kinase [Defluviitaleaceae bacterium]|nr:dephospho-CoA kinase [Defluviitaleaceae bacterium]
MKPNRIILGVTGGSGVGKGEVCNILKEMGVQILYADAIGHEVILKDRTGAYTEIWKTFGEKVLNYHGEIDRKILGEIVFKDKEKLAQLNDITHKYIIQRILEAFALSKSRIIAIDAPLLIEAGLHEMCHVVLGVFAPMELRKERIIKRDGITPEDAAARINSQMSDSDLAIYCDYIIHNDGTLEDLTLQMADFSRVIEW